MKLGRRVSEIRMKVDFSSTHLLLCLSSFVLSCLLVLSLSASFSLFAAPFCNEGRRAANCTHRAQLTQMGEKSGHQTLPLVALVCSCLPASQQVLPIVERDEKEKKRLGWWRMANGRRQERERERDKDKRAIGGEIHYKFKWKLEVPSGREKWPVGAIWTLWNTTQQTTANWPLGPVSYPRSSPLCSAGVSRASRTNCP